MYGQVALAVHHACDTPPIRKREFSLTCEAAEYRYDVLGRFVRLVDDEYAPVHHSAQQRRVRVPDHAALKCGLEHELLYGRVTVELDVLSWPLKKLRRYSEREPRTKSQHSSALTWHNLSMILFLPTPYARRR